MFEGFVKSLDFLKWLGFKGRPQAVRQPAGYTKTTGPFGEVIDADTLQCCHCGGHFEVVVGSNIERGWCRDCSTDKVAYTCGRPECMICLPFEERLNNLEHGRPELAPRALVLPVEAPKIILGK